MQVRSRRWLVEEVAGPATPDLCPARARHEHGEALAPRGGCHGCALVAETCCEMRNDYLDRALVVPVLGVPDAAFFGATP